MDSGILFAVLAGFLLVIGLIGCVVPALPGVPLAWAGLFAAHFCTLTLTPKSVIIVTGIITIIVTVLDTVLQPWLTKKFGGSKSAVWGATIGLVVAMFLGPVFILIGPFAGAFIGEMIANPDDTVKALKAAAGSFIGFLLGTGIKMICVIAFIWIFVWELIR